MKLEQAIALGEAALLWLAERPELLEGFMAASGAGVADLRAGARDPEFLGFILDFILQSDEWVIAFASHAEVSPDRPARARAALPGGYAPDWT